MLARNRGCCASSLATSSSSVFHAGYLPTENMCWRARPRFHAIDGLLTSGQVRWKGDMQASRSEWEGSSSTPWACIPYETAWSCAYNLRASHCMLAPRCIPLQGARTEHHVAVLEAGWVCKGIRLKVKMATTIHAENANKTAIIHMFRACGITMP
jgi:hypothetical protein